MAYNSQCVSEATQKLTALFEAFVGDIDPATSKGQKRRSILESATRMFAERGYRKTNMDELAGEVGVAKGTLYLYFPKKIDLLHASATYEKMRWLPRLLGILEGDAPASQRLKEWVIMTLTLPSESPMILRLLDDAEMAAMLADYSPEIFEEGKKLFIDLMQPLIDELTGPEHPLSAVELHDRVWVIRSIEHIAPMLRHEALRPGMSVERFASIFADLIVDGIRPRTQSQADPQP